MAGAKKYETTINKVNEILGDLKNKIYHPIYLLHGEEPYFIDIITNYIENNILSDALFISRCVLRFLLQM